SRTRTGAAGGGYRGRRADALCGPAHQRAAARPGEAVHAEGTGAGQRAEGDGRLLLRAPHPGGVAGRRESRWTGPAAGRPRPASRRLHSAVVLGGWSMELYALPAHALRQMLERGEISSVELTKSLIERIEAVDGAIGSYLAIRVEEALTEAEEADRRIREQRDVGPLTGIPVSLKDNICTEGTRTTCASRMRSEEHTS